MKNINNILIVFISLFLLSSCVKEKEIENGPLNETELIFAGNVMNEPQSVTVNTLGQWSFGNIPEWLKVESAEGVDATDVLISTLSVNDTGVDREQLISLTYADGTAVVELNVKQTAASISELTDNIIEQTAEGYYMTGAPIHVYEGSTMQMSVSSVGYKYAIFTDDQTQILSITLSEMPELNGKTTITTTLKGITSTIPETGEYTLYKQEDNKLWFYNIGQKQGFIIRYL
ncbi:MAG: BACON domain-containing protein [Bacteroidetes bacterium]|nr:BACON domain-containing protein [Bacteroidota bacterium]